MAIQAIHQRTDNSSGVANLLATEVTGASAGVALNYATQKALFKNSDRFLPMLRESKRTLGKIGLQAPALTDAADFITKGKINNKALLWGAVDGAAVAGIGYILYSCIKKAVGQDDENFGNKTLAAAGIGAGISGLLNALQQNHELHKMSLLKNELTEGIQCAVNAKQKGLARSLRKSFRNLKESIGKGNIIKTFAANAAVKGALVGAAAYGLYRGVEASFNKASKRPIALIAITDDGKE